jgi:hypothetical protein
MCDYSEYDQEINHVTYITEKEEYLLEPGDILIPATATNDDLIQLIEYLVETKKLSFK